MAWPGIKTWVPGPWQYTDANSYIRDAFVSVRRYQTSMHYYNGSGTVGVADGWKTIGTAVSGVCTTTPDEATRTLIILSLYAGPTTAGTVIDYRLRDQAHNQLEEANFDIASSGQFGVGPLVGVIASSAGVNCGFDVQVQVFAGSAQPIYWSAAVITAPVT